LASKIPGGALAGAGLGIAGMAGEYAGGKLEEAGYEKSGAAVSTLGTAAKYGGMGAMIGSVVPGVGTAIGGAIGGAVGLGVGLYENVGKFFGGDKKQEQTSGNNEFDKRYQEKLNKLPENFRNDVGVQQNIREEVMMEMKAEGYSAKEYIPSQKSPAHLSSDQVSPTASSTSNGSYVASSQKPSTGMQVAQTSTENNNIRDEMSKSTTTQPVVSNNVQTSNNTNYVPIKADPRPLHRGSALDRYNDRIAAY
jgi:hypothetical protein